MNAPRPLRRGRVSGELLVPGSKSITNRALVAAACAEGESTLLNPLDSSDTRALAAALTQPRFAFVGLIGSQSKRARFLSRLREGGLSDAALHNLVCPIGLPQIVGKDPPVIAASVAAQLLAARASLQRRDARGSGAAAVSEALNLS